ncbi:MAG: hypothetical protein AVDCRST_MAG36-1623 [uncultured Nocardioidaceae bacterium]|uniref:Uncharacterized protein n=1 Tax=uncultured Nocardioidaceae bacterium TaxID=253824 RepID=A0A6J4LZF9_9ACTN|nr:MAG: hypothetical protein AVDCRST_MAG36-1623 [uncultured Nocardioidaceae bacterium]
MTRHEPPDPLAAVDPADPVLSEEEEREVTALLLQAAGTGPVPTPSAVTARLDDVLAGLVAERAAGSGTTTPTAPAGTAGAHGATAAVVPLERRRRRLPQVLLAAAAVVVGGYAVGNAALDGSLTGMTSSSDSSAGGAGEGADDSDSGGDAAGGQSEEQSEAGGLAGEMSFLPSVRRDHLAADVRRVVRLFDQRPATGGTDEAPEDGGLEQTPGCPVPRLAEGQRLYEVRYQDRPAGLVVGPRQQGEVGVTVYSCRDGGVQLSRTVPLP